MLDGSRSRDLCTRILPPTTAFHILMLTDKGGGCWRARKKLVATSTKPVSTNLLGPANRAALLDMLATIAREF